MNLCSLQVAESVVSICSTPMATKCRLIDRVIITGPLTKYVRIPDVNA